MALDPKIEGAIQTAVQAAGQAESISKGLVAWFDAVSSGNENLTDKDSTNRRLERLYGDTVFSQDEDGTEIDEELEESVRKVLEGLGLSAERDAGQSDTDLSDGSRSAT